MVDRPLPTGCHNLGSAATWRPWRVIPSNMVATSTSYARSPPALGFSSRFWPGVKSASSHWLCPGSQQSHLTIIQCRRLTCCVFLNIYVISNLELDRASYRLPWFCWRVTEPSVYHNTFIFYPCLAKDCVQSFILHRPEVYTSWYK